MFRLLAAVPLVMSVMAAAPAAAADLTVPMNLVDAQGNATPIGQVKIAETPYGLAFEPDLKSLKPGLHGFHVHEKGSCAPANNKDGAAVAALGAGGHFDPAGSNRHGVPWGDGHLGDLPGLYLKSDGMADYPVLAPRLKSLADIRGRSLMVHEGGDNHADHPAPLGGGGARIACGVIPG